MPCKVWDEITHPFPNFNGCTVEVWKRISNIIPHFVWFCPSKWNIYHKWWSDLTIAMNHTISFQIWFQVDDKQKSIYLILILWLASFPSISRPFSTVDAYRPYFQYLFSIFTKSLARYEHFSSHWIFRTCGGRKPIVVDNIKICLQKNWYRLRMDITLIRSAVSEWNLVYHR